MTGSCKKRISASPCISHAVPAFSGVSPESFLANDGDYSAYWDCSVPDYIAYDLSAVPPQLRYKVIAVWYNKSTYFPIGGFQTRDMIPENYTIEVHTAPGGLCPPNCWKTILTVTGNKYSSRQHIIDLSGCNWIRMKMSSASGSTTGLASLVFDIHSITDSLYDSWLFLGDSITGCGMNNCYGTSFAAFINQLDERFFPIQENGGIGGTTSADGRAHIDRWLDDSPARFISIAYGTNDIWGKSVTADEYLDNNRCMINSVLRHGKIPILPKIPFAADKTVGKSIPAYNAAVEKLWTEYGDSLIKGPDFEAFFSERSHLLSDGVHPTQEGYEAMRRLWAETMYENIYN